MRVKIPHKCLSRAAKALPATAVAFAAGIFFSGCGSFSAKDLQPAAHTNLRAPAYPLITIDPYTSGWSMSDKLYDSPVRHWTGQDMALLGAVTVDGTAYRFMGEEKTPMKVIAPTFETENWNAKYTFTEPKGDWTAEDYDASSWDEGKGSFGSPGRLKAITSWRTPDIWVRREINVDEDMLGRDLFIEYSHDDGAEIYINGFQVVNTGNSARAEVRQRISHEAKAHLHAGKNIIAAHCNDGGGESFLDFGLLARADDNRKFAVAAEQKSATVMPTQTYYTFECGGIALDIVFTAPLLLDDLELASRPVNYITCRAKSTDGKTHDVSVYFEAGPQWAQNKINQPVKSEQVKNDRLHVLKSGTKSQEILGKSGDNVRIDWGYVYFAAPTDNGNATASSIGEALKVRDKFLKNGSLDNVYNPVADGNIANEPEALSISRKLGTVGENYSTFYVMLGYDDVCSIQYFGENLRPYWNRDNKSSIGEQLRRASDEYEQVMGRCARFDAKLMRDAKKTGGDKYAELCALAYRQAISAHKLVQAPNGDLLWLSKENFSNGSIGTVDVTYPSAPMFLYYNTALAKGLLNHIFYYSESGRWKKPFPSHDIGTYPLANGQTYGGDMPVEEAGNMLILTAAIAAVDGNADYAKKHWDVLTVWTDYLVENGLDPENQLCTDDFAGHFAHNVNLSVKAILGIASYGYLAKLSGKTDTYERYTQLARNMAAEWMKMANDGDHYRLTFDKPDTWSQKYNMVWDNILGLDIFDKSIVQKEIPYYLTKQNEYGLPLDNRRNYTKSDWIIWTATFGNDSSVFEQLIEPIYRFYNETVDRVPMSDWYNTDSKTHVGFQARSVVGGYFIKMLKDKMK
ncbi:MAG: DUF4965 domain-containing protein [Prevotellaceae bacterium]|jgi:hypothetical protein|nr:DUF4965 domain-containing protein [Prevotellaceae bacterium]